MPSFVALDPQKEIRDPEDGSQINPPGFCLFFLPFQDDLRYVFYNGILLPKLFWPTVRKNCSRGRGKHLKFEAEGREFAKILRPLEQFIQTMKGQKSIW